MDRNREGELYLVSEAILWSLFPIITLLSSHALSPMCAAGLSTMFAIPFFSLVLTIKREWGFVRRSFFHRDILRAVIIIGLFYYGLIFIGSGLTTAGNASIIMLMEIFFSVAILGLLGKERVTRNQIFGGVLMAAGACLVLLKDTFSLNEGDLIILVATAFPPLGNYYTQRARKDVSASVIMFIRSVLSGPFFILLSLCIEPSPTSSQLSTSLGFLFINGFFLLGLSKLLWIESIHRISISKAISLSPISPLFTLLFAYMFLGETPTLHQLLGIAPMTLGIFLLTRKELK